MGSSKGLSQNSSPYELSKLSAHSLEGVRWESTGSPLGVRWESAGSPPGVRWEPAGSPLGVRWESTGSPLGVHFTKSSHELSPTSLQALNRSLQKLPTKLSKNSPSFITYTLAPTCLSNTLMSIWHIQWLHLRYHKVFNL